MTYMSAVFSFKFVKQFLEIFRKQYRKMLLFNLKLGLLILSLIRKKWKTETLNMFICELRCFSVSKFIKNEADVVTLNLGS